MVDTHIDIDHQEEFISKFIEISSKISDLRTKANLLEQHLNQIYITGYTPYERVILAVIISHYGQTIISLSQMMPSVNDQNDHSRSLAMLKTVAWHLSQHYQHFMQLSIRNPHIYAAIWQEFEVFFNELTLTITEMQPDWNIENSLEN